VSEVPAAGRMLAQLTFLRMWLLRGKEGWWWKNVRKVFELPQR